MADDGHVTRVGGTKIADPANRRAEQLDVVALSTEADGQPAIRLIGEVKWSPDAFGPQAADRLVHARQLLGAAGHDVDRCELALISRHPPRAARPAVAIGLDEPYAV